MVKYPNYLSGSQDDINKRLLEMILKLAKSEGTDIASLVSDVETLQGDVGKTDASPNSLKKRCKAIEDAIGSETTEGTILYRIKQLEPSGTG